MTKQELMENYTMEQLADMVVDLQKLAEATTALVNNKADEIKELKSQLDRKKTEINQIDDILNKLFGVTHDVVSKTDEFERILREKADGYKAISDFLPTEPIEVASMLINAEGEYEHIPVMKRICGMDKGTYNLFDISELRQIAEHLLVYCRASESEGKE